MGLFRTLVSTIHQALELFRPLVLTIYQALVHGIWVTQSFCPALFVLAFEEVYFEQCAFLMSLVSIVYPAFKLAIRVT